MRISEQRVKRLIRESIRENLLREGQAWKSGGIKDFKFPHCDVSQFDPTFMKVLNLFQSDSYSGQKDYAKNSFITNLANAMGAEPDFISPSLLTAFNNLLIPGAELLGKMPVGSIAICKLLTKLSKEYTSIFKEAERGYNPDKLDNRPNKSKDDLPQKRQYYLNGLIKNEKFKEKIVNPSNRGDIKGIFKYTVDKLSQEIGEANINGLDAIFFQMFIPNTITTKKIDINEKRQLINFTQDFIKEAEYAKDLRGVLEVFNRLFEKIVTNDDSEYAGFFSPGTRTIKHKRANVFVGFLLNDMSNLSSLFESPKDLIKSIVDELQRINKFTK